MAKRLRKVLYLYTMVDYMETAKEVKITDDGHIVWINGKAVEPIPIEDYGDYLLRDRKVDDAFGEWSKLAFADDIKFSDIRRVLCI